MEKKLNYKFHVMILANNKTTRISEQSPECSEYAP